MKKFSHVIIAVLLALCLFGLTGCSQINDTLSTMEQDLLNAETAYNDGVEDGYDAGYQEGNTEGYAVGYDDGSAEGYKKGYAEGQAVAKSSESEKGSEISIDEVGLEIHFVDVGQGDAIVIRCGDGTDIIVDAGSGTSENSTVTKDYINYLKDIEIGTIDYVIATHAHSDHMNMLDNVLETFEVKNIWYNGYSTTPTQKFFTDFEGDASAEDGANIVKFDNDGDTYNLKTGDYNITVYAPGYDSFENVNYESPIILVEYAGIKVLLTGDAEEDAEKLFMQRLGVATLDIDVLKVGHHGSKAGTCDEFLTFTTPEFAVISAGDGNSYNHPTPDTMNDLFDSGIITYRTDRQGNIVLKIDTDGDFAFFVENYVPVDNNKFWKEDRMFSLTK